MGSTSLAWNTLWRKEHRNFLKYQELPLRLVQFCVVKEWICNVWQPFKVSKKNQHDASLKSLTLFAILALCRLGKELKTKQQISLSFKEQQSYLSFNEQQSFLYFKEQQSSLPLSFKEQQISLSFFQRAEKFSFSFFKEQQSSLSSKSDKVIFLFLS
jgi:hypothetical protein